VTGLVIDVSSSVCAQPFDDQGDLVDELSEVH
jgi:hypothetical protein